MSDLEMASFVRNIWSDIVLYPIVWYLMKKMMESIIHEMKKWFKDIQMAIWKTIIESSDVATEQASFHFQISAIDKVDFIQKI